MNKKLDIRKNTYILFVINIVVLVTMIFFKNIYIGLGYSLLLVNILFIINLILLMFGIIFNILFVKEPNKYNTKKYTIIIIALIIIYFILNTIVISIINNSSNSGYTKINEKLSSYCDSFECDKYETITEDGYEKFIIKKSYFDYDNEENNLIITTIYDREDILKVTAEIYSRKEMFSEKLIKQNIQDYFDNFDYEISDVMIMEAFNKRFGSSVKEETATYKVSEIYNDDILEKLKTTITLDLKQE